MAFCIHCGKELADGAKFCYECGTKVAETNPSNEETRKQVFEGVVHKCPQCGEVIESFTAKCPSCGHEFRDVRTGSVLYAFSKKLEAATTQDEQERLIRSFYIPNTKEDLTEFIIFATTNIEANPNCEKAWIAKLDQTYQKAKLALAGSSDFAYVEQLYSESMRKLMKKKVLSNTGKASVGVFRFISVIITGLFQLLAFIFSGIGKLLSYLAPDLPRIVVIGAWLYGIFALIPVVETNDNDLWLFILFVAGMVLIPFFSRGKTFAPLLITVLGQIISIIILLSYPQDSDYSLMVFTDVVSALVIMVRSFIRRTKNE